MPPLTLTPLERRVFLSDLCPPPREVTPPPSRPRGGRKPGRRGRGWGRLGAKGVTLQPNGRYLARSRTNGVLVSLGAFDAIQEAAEAVRRHEEGAR